MIVEDVDTVIVVSVVEHYQPLAAIHYTRDCITNIGRQARLVVIIAPPLLPVMLRTVRFRDEPDTGRVIRHGYVTVLANA